ncbi:MAG TPA: hydrogenase expression/formation protein HypE [Kiritimatiellia bacterium]|nr:hydrogenase expression/formation protein HypE [Kiritimatiellia bacterium]
MLACPIPISDYPVVTLAHGGGGHMMRRLIRDVFVAALGNDTLQSNTDSALLDIPSGRIAFTTDSFVVKPLFFPGGNIGTLAVNGTVNDLAMAGARPRHLSCGLILEEGLPMDTLWRIMLSMKQAADAAGVSIVTGDTKVVDKGKGDGVFINTSGIGELDPALRIGPDAIRPGDVILTNGDIARHGMAILAAREELALEAPIDSDCAPLNHAVAALLQAGIDIHALRDATRGGVASALVEMAQDARREFLIEESAIPVREDVRGACELLGIDPLYVANEGRMVCLVPEEQADAALAILRTCFPDTSPARIGTVQSRDSGRLVLRSLIGAKRMLDLLSGEQLPRIC